MRVTMINLPDENPDARLQWQRKLVAPAGARVRDVLTKEGPGVFSSPNTRLFELLAEEARRRYRVAAGTQILYRSSTDARFLRPRGIQTYGVSPFPVTFFQSVSIHNADESITVGAFQEGVDYLTSVVRAWSDQ
jgi:acetylornithine deacetylase/succinyl-diaminopimelate desuccinylase-like protein